MKEWCVGLQMFDGVMTHVWIEILRCDTKFCTTDCALYRGMFRNIVMESEHKSGSGVGYKQTA